MSGSRGARLGVVVALALATLLACGHDFEEFAKRDVPVSVVPPGTDQVDMGLLLETAQGETLNLLPDAHLNVFTYKGDCASAPSMKGTFNMQFAKTRWNLRGREILTVLVSVDTKHGMMSGRGVDYTGTGLVTDPVPVDPDVLRFQEAAQIAYDKLSEAGVADCRVFISRSGNRWIVECLGGASGSCLFYIDPTTGAITTPPYNR